jgi:hypothetical protein
MGLFGLPVCRWEDAEGDGDAGLKVQGGRALVGVEEGFFFSSSFLVTKMTRKG